MPLTYKICLAQTDMGSPGHASLAPARLARCLSRSLVFAFAKTPCPLALRSTLLSPCPSALHVACLGSGLEK
ncbi:MAG: hypothetical protein FJ088_01800 [Deltaproteobacteria bacterium]|nr:hypothetical protein [Deltaproteobacteria bacterium]